MTLLLEAGCGDRFRAAALEALPVAGPELQGLLLRDLLLRGPDLGPGDLGRILPHVQAAGIREAEPRRAWAARARAAGLLEEAAELEPPAEAEVPEAGPGPDPTGLTPAEEARFEEAHRRGRLGALEPELWALLEAAARGERRLGEGLEWLTFGVLAPGVREGDAEGVLQRLDRAERLLAGQGGPEARRLERRLAEVRIQVQRMARLLAGVGPAARP